MTNRAIIMLCPIGLANIANASFAKLGVGPETLTVPYAAGVAPSVKTHLMCHWNNPSASLTATLGQMVSGTLPVECLDEIDRPITVTWDSPTEADALEAMAAITFKSIPYDDPSTYSPSAEVASIASLAGLVRWEDPEAED